MNTVLVLNVNYEPLTVVPMVRAMNLVAKGKVQVVETVNDSPI